MTVSDVTESTENRESVRKFMVRTCPVVESADVCTALKAEYKRLKVVEGVESADVYAEAVGEVLRDRARSAGVDLKLDAHDPEV